MKMQRIHIPFGSPMQENSEFKGYSRLVIP